MLRAKDYKNKNVATPHGNVKFNHEGIANSNKDSELLLSKFSDFEYVEEKEPEQEVEKKAPVKRAPRKRSTTKKEVEK